MNQLKRDLGTLDAVLLGLGSIVGTGIFVSIALAASVAGPWVLLAILLASLVAVCNGLSSAQLAAAHPVSGGTYEYANRWINSTVGFVAGWMFLIAKSASAATAAIGFAQYVLPWVTEQSSSADQLPGMLFTVTVAYGILGALLWAALMGIRRSARVNTVLVAITVGALMFFVVAGLIDWWSGQFLVGDKLKHASSHAAEMAPLRWSNLWEATALMFVAYTGYGRIATLGEEVRNPRQTIPRAIIATLLCSMLLYFSVALVVTLTTGAEVLAAAARAGGPALPWVAEQFSIPATAAIVGIGAGVSLLGVLFNLLLGLSRVALAMGRRGDLPARFANITSETGVPAAATWLVAGIIAGLVLLGSIETAWSLSAFTVLIYYGITNACVLRMEPELRMYPVWPAWLGLATCCALAFCVTPAIWMIGCGLIVLGLIWRWGYRSIAIK